MAKWYQFLITRRTFSLDLTVNRSCKLLLRDLPQIWYAEQEQGQIYYNYIHTYEDIVKNGWRRSEIIKAIKENISKKDTF